MHLKTFQNKEGKISVLRCDDARKMTDKDLCDIYELGSDDVSLVHIAANWLLNPMSIKRGTQSTILCQLCRVILQHGG